MGDPVNLNLARKARAATQAKAEAAANRVRFGQPKAQTQLQIARRDKAARDLDAKKREP